ncbi:MAG: mechanosensitive ion channel [Clostridia bacterium]|nr:mechanosensitive ion channel [Clostridia bacterium]
MRFFQLPLAEQSLVELIKARNYDGILSLILQKAPSVIAAVLIVVIGFIVSNLIGKLVVKAMRAKGVDPSIHSFIKTVITLLLKFVVILSAFSTLGIDVNSFITALGAAGITAGIGLQASISQIASGVQILANHPFKSGDYIDVGTVSGKVQEIKIMYTVLITVDNKRVIIPNSYITSNNIINYNAEDRRRLDLVFSISYDADISKAREVIKEVIDRNNLIFTDPEPIIAVKEHAASSVNLACLIWCSSNEYWNVFYYMQEAVKVAFDENKISIPYGQLDIHISKE